MVLAVTNPVDELIEDKYHGQEHGGDRRGPEFASLKKNRPVAMKKFPTKRSGANEVAPPARIQAKIKEEPFLEQDQFEECALRHASSSCAGKYFKDGAAAVVRPTAGAATVIPFTPQPVVNWLYQVMAYALS